MKVKIDEFFQVCSYDLVRVDENDFLQVHGEEHVEEKNLIGPDDALLLGLGAQPRWPFVRYEFILEVVLLRHVRDEFLQKKTFISPLITEDWLCTRNEGDRKFSMNQNLTVLFVLRSTLRIMIPTNRWNLMFKRVLKLHHKRETYLVEKTRSNGEDVDLSLRLD